ncbi:MAG: phasin family protein [Ideonella sp.]|nr:phasin family protein [Ideonella sp.]MCC7455446.1 phasin family protein [Nitrospira sp.]
MANTRASKKGNGAAVAPTHAALPTAMPTEGWVGLTRDQLELAMQATTAWLRSVEALRKVQWDMTHLAVQRHRELQRRLHEATELSDLAALQVELMRFDSAAALRSAQELYDAALHSATEAFEGARTTIDASHNDGLMTWLQAMSSALRTGVKPLDDAFGSLWMRPLAAPTERPHTR